eukprot:scaffold154787_cov29-Tisochrysis_lutea.AAC.1
MRPPPLPRAARCIYLDYQATTPVWPEVAEAAIPFLTTHWGNPSSAHAYGRPCAHAVEKARRSVSALLGASPSEILFSSCGSEADNHAICGAVALVQTRARAAGHTAHTPHVVTTNAEHPAVERCLAALQAEGRCSATFVPVDAEGRVGAQAIVAALRPETALVTVMHANNEVGSVNPIAEICAAVHARSPATLVHTDAAQSVGKIEVHVKELGVDMLTLVGHKIGAPKGVAALYVREGLELPNLLHGGGQESGRRAGTESVVLLAALGRACEIARDELVQNAQHMEETRSRLAQLLTEGLGGGGADGLPGVRINGPANPSLRLPNTLSIGLRGVVASALLERLSDRVAASAGAACHSGEASVSAVLRAMGVPLEYAIGTLRLSTGRHTTMDEVEEAAELIIGEAKRQKIEAAGTS